MSETEKFPILKIYELNIKKYRKFVRKKFKSQELMLKLNRMHENLKKFRVSANDIMSIVFDAFSKSKTFETRNNYYIQYVIDDLFIFYKDMSERITEVNDNIVLKSLHEVILDKNSEVLKKLNENEKNPVNIGKLI